MSESNAQQLFEVYAQALNEDDPTPWRDITPMGRAWWARVYEAQPVDAEQAYDIFVQELRQSARHYITDWNDLTQVRRDAWVKVVEYMAQACLPLERKRLGQILYELYKYNMQQRIVQAGWATWEQLDMAHQQVWQKTADQLVKYWW